jgi:hypothetical protein
LTHETTGSQWNLTPNADTIALGKQSHIDTRTEGFSELERFGFEFGEFCFAGGHVHFQVNVPKSYSIKDAEIKQKSYSAKKIF